MDEARGVCPCAFFSARIRPLRFRYFHEMYPRASAADASFAIARRRPGETRGLGRTGGSVAGCGRVMRRPLDTFREKTGTEGSGNAREPWARGCPGGAAGVRLPGPWTCGCKGGAAAGAADRSCRGCGARGRRGVVGRAVVGGPWGAWPPGPWSAASSERIRRVRLFARSAQAPRRVLPRCGPAVARSPPRRKGRTAKGSDPPQKKGRCRVGSRREDAARRPRF